MRLEKVRADASEWALLSGMTPDEMARESLANSPPISPNWPTRWSGCWTPRGSMSAKCQNQTRAPQQAGLVQTEPW